MRIKVILIVNLSFCFLNILLYAFANSTHCYPKDNDLEKCFKKGHPFNGSITLMSGEEYELKFGFMYHILHMTINTTDAAPAIVQLSAQHISSYTTTYNTTMFSGGHVHIENLEIKGYSPSIQHQKGGTLFHSQESLTIRNAIVCDYIAFYTSFIADVTTLKISNTSFMNNKIENYSPDTAVGATTSMIGTKIDVSWDVTLESCIFYNNTVEGTNNDAKSLFFFFWGYENNENDNLVLDINFKLNIVDVYFIENTVLGQGSAFAWIPTTLTTDEPRNVLTFTNNHFVGNVVSIPRAQVAVYSRDSTQCGQKYSVWCASFFVMSSLYTWGQYTSNFKFEDFFFSDNLIEHGSNFFLYEQVLSSVEFNNLTFKNSILIDNAWIIALYASSASLLMTSMSFENIYLNGSSDILNIANPANDFIMSDFSSKNLTFYQNSHFLQLRRSSGYGTMKNISFMDVNVTGSYLLYVIGSSGGLLFDDLSFSNIEMKSLFYPYSKKFQSVLTFGPSTDLSTTIQNSHFEKIRLDNAYVISVNVSNTKLENVTIENINLRHDAPDFENLEEYNHPAVLNLIGESDVKNCNFNDISIDDIPFIVAPSETSEAGIETSTWTDCIFSNIQVSEGSGVLGLDADISLSLENAVFQNCTSPYDLSNISYPVTIETCTWPYGTDYNITTSLSFRCNEAASNSDDPSPEPDSSSPRDLIILIWSVTLFLCVSLLFNIYSQRMKLYGLYTAYQERREKMRKAYMRENELKALISAHGNNLLGSNKQELNSIENILGRAVPDVIIPFDKIKLDGGLIAKGGSGIVMKGTYARSTIAIKVIQSQIAGDMEEFQGELNMLYSLNHPNIIRFIGISFHEGAVLMLQEYCPIHLGQYVESKGVFRDVNLFLDMLLTIMETMIYLHEKNIVHRDLKPENILLDDRNKPKICDLGMAKFVNGDGNYMSFRADGTGALGTPGYMPPEMTSIKEGDHYQPKYWDVFSLAMIVYFMWSGKHPLVEYENAFAISNEIHKGTRPILPPAMPEKIRDIVRQMWHQDFTKRPNVEKSYALLSSAYSQEMQSQTDHIQLNPIMEQL